MIYLSTNRQTVPDSAQRINAHPDHSNRKQTAYWPQCALQWVHDAVIAQVIQQVVYSVAWGSGVGAHLLQALQEGCFQLATPLLEAGLPSLNPHLVSLPCTSTT